MGGIPTAADWAEYDRSIVRFYKAQLVKGSREPLEETAREFAEPEEVVRLAVNAAIAESPGQDLRKWEG